MPRPRLAIVTGRSAILAGLLCLGAALAACSPVDLLNATVPEDGYSVTTDIAYGDGARRRLDVYRPATAGEPAPVVVFFYGGSWRNGDRGDYRFVAQALVSEGLVAVLPDYRVYPEVVFPGFLEDGAAAIRWVRDSIAGYGGDPERIFLIGHSAGAYNAAMLAVDPRYLSAVGVDREAIAGFVGLAGPYDFLPLDTRITRRVFGGAADLSATQPVTFADSNAPPMLLLAGENDGTVYPRNSVSLSETTEERGGNAEVRLYPDLGHIGIVLALADGQRHRAPVLDDVAAFIGAH